MSLEVFFAVTAFLFATVYLFLGLLAYQHRVSEKVSRNWGLSPIWSMFPEDYDKTGQNLCIVGRKFFWLSMSFSFLWLVLEATSLQG